MKKSQMTADLIIVSALVLAIFSVLFSIIDYRNNEITSSKKYLEVKDIAENIAFAINEVYISGFGTTKRMYVINETFDNEPINIRVLPKNRLVVVEWGTNFYTAPLVTSRINGSIKGDTSKNISLIMGNLSLRNYMGGITLEQ